MEGFEPTGRVDCLAIDPSHDKETGGSPNRTHFNLHDLFATAKRHVMHLIIGIISVTTILILHESEPGKK